MKKGLKLIDNYYRDKNKNYWSKEKYTLEQAERASETVVDCYLCIDCEHLIDCVGCSFSSYLVNCVNCTWCHYSSNLVTINRVKNYHYNNNNSLYKTSLLFIVLGIFVILTVIIYKL